jgi:hypothetical protein
VSWENSPYRILVYVLLDPAPEWRTDRRANLLTEIRSQSQSLIGGLWQLKVVDAPPELKWNTASEIESVATDSIPQAALDHDKVMLLGILSPGSGRHQFQVREFDVRTRIWGPAYVEVPRPGSDFAQEALRALWKAFRPLVRIDEISEQGTVTARVRGGDLPPAMRRLELVSPGMALRPITRHFDRNGRTLGDGVFPVAWTLLNVEDVTGATAKCRLFTGVEDPLELKYDGRTEYLGIRTAAPTNSSTELMIKARGPDGIPLEDLEVFGQSPIEKTPHPLGRTDERGAIKIEAASGIELEMVSVRSGGELLARFPLAPGVEKRVVVEVQDNGRRLETGELVARLGEELIDLVAQQTVLEARFQRQLVRGDLDEAERTLGTLKTLKTSESFLKSIDDRRAALPTAASDAAAAAWLDKRLEEIKPLATKHLIDSQVVARLQGVLTSLRSR